MTDSCLVHKLDIFLRLTDREKEALVELEKSPRDYAAGETIFEEGDDADTLYVVQHGWLYSSNMLADGSRQILLLHYPGDILGTASIAFDEAGSSVVAGEPATLCRFPKNALGRLFDAHPRLAALIYALGMVENVTLSDRLRVLGSSPGKGRLAGFIMEIVSRLRATHDEQITHLDMTLTQADIGDAVGLNKIHINRLFRELEQEDFAIRREGRRIEILREDFLCDISSFANRYREIDTSWFPPPQS